MSFSRCVKCGEPLNTGEIAAGVCTPCFNKPPVEGGETATLRRQIGVCEDCGRHGALPGGKCGACKAIWDLHQQMQEKDDRIRELEAENERQRETIKELANACDLDKLKQGDSP